MWEIRNFKIIHNILYGTENIHFEMFNQVQYQRNISPTNALPFARNTTAGRSSSFSTDDQAIINASFSPPLTLTLTVTSY